MASRGSVIPHFISQIKKNIPVTITNPEMTRFLMSLDEAVDLVLYAFKNGAQGDLFVQKAPASTIGDLATALKEIFNSSVNINIIGTRHGEKLFETLCTTEEMSKAIDLDGFYKIPSDNRDLNYENYFDNGDGKLSNSIDYNSHNTYRLNIEEIKEKLFGLKEIKNDLPNLK
jgi:UDP-glucose 4-epimerase